MPFLSNQNAPLGFTSFSDEAKRRVAIGDSESVLYLVPNRIAQRRMERELVEAAMGRAIAKPNVLTLADFAGELCKVAFPTLRLISDAESGVLIEQAIRVLIQENRLHYFERARDEESGAQVSYGFPIPRGTLELVVNTIRQLKESGVTVIDIERDLTRSKALHGETTETRRASDIMAIYKEYMDVLVGKSMMDTYGQTLLLNVRYEDSSTPAGSDFRNRFPKVSEVFIDGFYHLERPAVRTLSTIAKIGGLSVAIHLDAREDNPGLFGEVTKLQNSLIDEGFVFAGEASLARRASSPAPDATSPHEFRAWLRRYLFAAEEENLEKLNAPAVQFWQARDMVEEVEEIARKIKLICESDPDVRADLSRIVVATPLAEMYTPLFQEAFRRNDIPVQIADRHHLDRSPLMLALLALFDIARYGLRRRETIRVLASPYFDFTHASGERLDAENMLNVLARHKPSGGLRGWKKSLTGHLAKLELQKEQSDDSFEFDRLQAEEVSMKRALLDLDRLTNILAPFEQDLIPADFCSVIRRLLADLHVRERLVSHSVLTIEAGTLELDVRAFAAFTRLLNDLESLFALMGIANKGMPLTYYVERLKAASIWVRYTTRPRRGAVLVTSLSQSIAQPADYLFIAGLTEGALPAVYQPQVFLMNDMQKGELRQLLEDRVLFYQSVTNFRRQLFLSSPKRSSNGAEVSRSIFLDALEEVVTTGKAEEAEGIFSYRDLYLRLGMLLANKTELQEVLLSNIVDNLPNGFYARTLREHVPRALAAQTARANPEPSIYSGLIDPFLLTEEERAALERNQSRVWSVTQLEMYAGCPFKYFSRYVLGIGESDESEDGLDARDRGSVLHEVLREFMTSRRERNLAPIQDLSERDLPDVYDDVRDIAERHMSEIASDHPFWKLDRERLLPKEREGSVLWKFIRREAALKPVAPRPRFFEVSFGGEGGKTGRSTERDEELSRDEPVIAGGIKLRGKIDRIDVAENPDGDSTFTIVDYKSGQTTAKWSDIERGLSLQLPLYLRVAEDLIRSHIPEIKGVAALYHKLLGPESERTLGIAVKEYMGTSFEKIGSRNGYVESKEELAAVIEATVEKAKSYVDGISQGSFRLTERDLVKNCEYCPYGQVCRVKEAVELGVLV